MHLTRNRCCVKMCLLEVLNMKETVGVIKEIDNLGRIVIPKDMRDRLSFDKKVEVVLTKDGVLVRNPEYELIRVKNQTVNEK